MVGKTEYPSEKQGGRVPRRIAQTVLGSLKGGVVPRIGLPHIAVGRRSEIEALLRDIDVIGEGGATFRFIVGRYGSGKSFLLQTIRNYAMDRGFVVADADLSPERRLQGTHGQGLATYRELVKNLSVKARPEGGALTLVLDKWINNVQLEVNGDADLVEKQITKVIRNMNDLVHGFDFARLLTLYYRSFVEGDDETKSKVLKWFRGEYATKTEARQELGVNVIITDDDWYDYMKLLAFFFRQAGYQGLLMLVDELVNIYKVPHAITRQYNYEKLLAMYNDALQGKAQYIGTLMCGTPQCLEDPHRGIYSYEALKSRLQESKFSREGGRDLLAPVIRLVPLTSEEMLVLAGKLADLHADLYGYGKRITDDDLAAFIKIEYSRIGADEHITPREVIRDFIELLDILYQNPGISLTELLSKNDFSFSKPVGESKEGGRFDAEFAEFSL
ncbi:MAG: ATP-binding protein [Bacteroidales bacterium]|nr:ATP-binding protein [Bacteroidales bacterium]